MSKGLIDSIELWAAGKIVARECATINKDYMICKKEEGSGVDVCAVQAAATLVCTTEV